MKLKAKDQAKLFPATGLEKRKVVIEGRDDATCIGGGPHRYEHLRPRQTIKLPTPRGGRTGHLQLFDLFFCPGCMTIIDVLTFSGPIDVHGHAHDRIITDESEVKERVM